MSFSIGSLSYTPIKNQGSGLVASAPGRKGNFQKMGIIDSKDCVIKPLAFMTNARQVIHLELRTQLSFSKKDGKLNYAVLSADTRVKINGKEFIMAKHKKLRFDRTGSRISSGTLAKPTKIKNSAGEEVTFKGAVKFIYLNDKIIVEGISTTKSTIRGISRPPQSIVAITLNRPK